MEEELEHGGECNCKKCQQARYFKRYYQANRKRIIEKNSEWMKRHYKKSRASLTARGKRTKKTLLKKYGPDYYKRVSEMGKKRILEKYGPDGFSVISRRRKFKLPKPVQLKGTDKILKKINKLVG